MPSLELVRLVSTRPAFAFVAFAVALLLRDGIAAVWALYSPIQPLVVVQLGQMILRDTFLFSEIGGHSL